MAGGLWVTADVDVRTGDLQTREDKRRLKAQLWPAEALGSFDIEKKRESGTEQLTLREGIVRVVIESEVP
ncbi:MAG TPA: hypothetical protein VN654_09770 [Vicinamibacterales bacterium]|jgi:hypothetical protein|nr:hypothetical protein [Vicinamibacterales bacterium]